MRNTKEYLILEAYENKWVETIKSKAEAKVKFKKLQEEDTEGDYFLFESKEL